MVTRKALFGILPNIKKTPSKDKSSLEGGFQVLGRRPGNFFLPHPTVPFL
jgi:hypothetical protein